MSKPIPDKAEVMLEYPEKLYAGTFERSARFDAHFDDRGASLLLDHPGDTDTRKSVHLHVRYALLADILTDLAKTVSAIPTEHTAQRTALADAAKALQEALAPPLTSADEAELGRLPVDDIAEMSPQEAVLLLHVLE
jgi:hypothetical protein